MRADRGNEIVAEVRRRPRRRWAKVGGAFAAVAAIGLLASSCTGPLKAQKTTLALSCVRSDANGKRVLTYNTNATVGVSMPTFVHKGDKATIQDATLAGPTHPDDWIVLRVAIASGSPT